MQYVLERLGDCDAGINAMHFKDVQQDNTNDMHKILIILYKGK
jgi:hypothetical protein